jgi:hypothetical protein
VRQAGLPVRGRGSRTGPYACFTPPPAGRGRARYVPAARVCLGEIGAVLGREISRLGRSNADLARLAEMARLTGTLLIDSDGVYDLTDFNDWLVPA